MASSIEVRLKRVDDSYKNATPLMWMTTTPTRVLRDGVDLVYDGGLDYSVTEEELTKIKDTEYGYFTILTEEKLSEIIAFYDNAIVENQKEIEYYEALRTKLQDMLVNAANGEVYDRIKEDIGDTFESIAYYKEALEDALHYKNLWLYSVSFVFDFNILGNNKDPKFELIYFTD